MMIILILSPPRLLHQAGLQSCERHAGEIKKARRFSFSEKINCDDFMSINFEIHNLTTLGNPSQAGIHCIGVSDYRYCANDLNEWKQLEQVKN